jgi:hypothetical protein
MDLIERLSAATGPDRELDAEIWLAVTPGATREKWSYVHEATGRTCHIDETRLPSRALITVPAYTASLDAAMALIPTNWTGCIDGIGSHGVIARFGPPTDEATEYSGEHKHPAIALTIAALRARQTTASST